MAGSMTRRSMRSLGTLVHRSRMLSNGLNGTARSHQEMFQRGLEKSQHDGDTGKNHDGHCHAPEDVSMVLAPVFFVSVGLFSMVSGMLFNTPLGKYDKENEAEAVVGSHESAEKARKKPNLVG